LQIQVEQNGFTEQCLHPNSSFSSTCTPASHFLSRSLPRIANPVVSAIIEADRFMRPPPLEEPALGPKLLSRVAISVSGSHKTR
jgi:hypothetical protein